MDIFLLESQLFSQYCQTLCYQDLWDGPCPLADPKHK